MWAKKSHIRNGKDLCSDKNWGDGSIHDKSLFTIWIHFWYNLELLRYVSANTQFSLKWKQVDFAFFCTGKHVKTHLVERVNKRDFLYICIWEFFVFSRGKRGNKKFATMSRNCWSVGMSEMTLMLWPSIPKALETL